MVDRYAFDGDDNATVYYLPGSAGWGPTFAGCPTAIWLPELLPTDGNFGPPVSPFGFKIAWASGRAAIVEACTSLANPIWSPVATNTITDGTVAFLDAGWTNYAARFYRVRAY